MISDTTTSARYRVTNGVLSYGIPFRIYSGTDVAVFWSADARADTELTLGTHYTVTILTEGGMVNLLPDVVPVGSILAVVSNIPATQEADFSSTSAVSTEALETQLDRQVQMIQQLEDSVARSVVLPVTSSETPQDVVQDIYTARDEAEAAEAAASASENAAAASATKSAAQALLAEQSRGHACQCADRAEQARDVAMQQAEAINVVMATEINKINTAIAINKDDQDAAITASRAWSETDEDVPVDTDGEGTPEYSSKHWAMKSAQLLAGNASTTHKGVMQVGSGLDVADGLVSASVATPAQKGIGRVATLEDMQKPAEDIAGGPAFLAAGSPALEAIIPTFLIGSVFAHTASDTYVPNGCVPANGGEYTEAQFPSFYTDYLAAGRVVTCTYAEFAAQVAATGNCGKFALDADNQTFKVPLLKDGDSITQAASASELGKSVKAGLPNITGTFGAKRSAGQSASGTVSIQANSSLAGAEGSDANYFFTTYKLDASQGGTNPTYGNSTTVTDEQVRLRHFVVVASAQNNQSMFDWSAYMSALAGKANNDLSNLSPEASEIIRGAITLRNIGTRSTNGAWTLTGVTPGIPVHLFYAGVLAQAAAFSPTSGILYPTVTFGVGVYEYGPGYACVLPSSSTIVLTGESFEAGEVVYAYQ